MQPAATTPAARLDEADADLIAGIFAVLHQRTGVEFQKFRPATVRRRIFNRMISTGMASLEDYLAFLRASGSEAPLLLERITIKVSRFYRNPPVFDYLRSRVIPDLARTGLGLRVWCAGCGRGEEAYTLAMLLEESGVPGSIVASDIDLQALEAGLRGFYPALAAEDLPADLAARYLAPAIQGRETGWIVTGAIRQRVRFVRHDLTSLQPLDGGPFHLIACRNVLIYFQRHTTEAVQGMLRGALAPGGVICFGEAEWPSSSVAALLEPLASRARIFRATEVAA